jgi:4-amino-4-deoxy-L-arabinose transferase-like glycosyltransferase
MNRRHAAVFAIAALLFLWQLGGRDLWAPDEPYFAEGAREMVVEGQWWVPHVNGVVSTDKPPLFFWTIALLSLPGGEVTGWTARLPSALAALGTLLLVLRLAARRWGGRTAWIAGLVLATTLMFWDKARWGQIDSLLCLLIWSALSAFEAWRAGEADGRRAGLLFWLAVALAVLAKGPVGLLLPLGIALATLWSDGRLGAWRRFAPVAGPLLFAAVVGAWMAAATVSAAGEYSVWGALREHFVERGIHGMHHRQPPWYYVEVLPVQLLPWTGLVPGALVLAWRRRRADATSRLLLVVAAFVVVFFSVSTEKRDLYVLPAVPAFALLVAAFVDAVAFAGAAGEAEPPVRRRWLLAGQAAVGTLLAVVGLALPIAAAGRDEVPGWMAWVVAAMLLATGVGMLWGCRRSPRLAALAPAAGFAAAYLFAVTFAYPALEPRKSARWFARIAAAATAEARAAGGRVITHDLSNVPEALAFYGDAFYTVPVASREEVERHLARPKESWALVRGRTFEALPPELRSRLSVVAADRLSRRDVLLVVNRPGALRR